MEVQYRHYLVFEQLRWLESLQKIASYPVDYNSIVKNVGHRTRFLVMGA